MFDLFCKDFFNGIFFFWCNVLGRLVAQTLNSLNDHSERNAIYLVLYLDYVWLRVNVQLAVYYTVECEEFFRNRVYVFIAKLALFFINFYI